MSAAPRPVVEAWIGLGAPEAYPFAERLRVAAAEAGVAVHWRPALAQGPDDAALVRAQAQCAALGLPFRRPSTFPRDGAPAARRVLACQAIGAAEGADPATLVRAVLDANFARDHDIADPSRLGEILAEIDYDAMRVLERANAPDIEARLEAQAARARGAGWIGAPVLTVGDRVFAAADAPAALHAAATALA